MSIGDRFRDAREIYNQHGKQSQRDVAKALTVKKIDGEDVKITYSYLSKIENERPGDIGYKKVIALAEYYGVSPEWLLTGNGSPSRDVSIQSICNATGLSQSIVEHLISWNNEHKQSRASTERGTTRTEIANRVFDFLTSDKVATEFVKLDAAIRSPKHSRIGHEDEIINKRIQLSKEAESIDYSILSRNEYITFRCQILERQFSDFLATFCRRPKKQRIFREED